MLQTYFNVTLEARKNKMTAGSGNGSAGSGTQANGSKLDHSVLRSSIDISITGMKQALHALENGNKEVRITIVH